MSDVDILKGKKLLIVDDEPDVLETLKDLLDMCDIDTAADYETGERLLIRNKYDIAVLDIMGVKGYDLLATASRNGTPVLMLTAHALSSDNFAKSITGGAKAYIPKEKMADIALYLSDLLKAQQGEEKPEKWFGRLKSFFTLEFGRDWLKAYRELQEKYGPFYDE